jgi:hypothetical protein
VTPTLSVEEATVLLNEWADDLENENYHSEAGVIWDKVIPALAHIHGRVTIMVVVYDELRTLVVQP